MHHKLMNIEHKDKKKGLEQKNTKYYGLFCELCNDQQK